MAAPMKVGDLCRVLNTIQLAQGSATSFVVGGASLLWLLAHPPTPCGIALSVISVTPFPNEIVRPLLVGRGSSPVRTSISVFCPTLPIQHGLGGPTILSRFFFELVHAGVDLSFMIISRMLSSNERIDMIAQLVQSSLLHPDGQHLLCLNVCRPWTKMNRKDRDRQWICSSFSIQLAC